MIKLIKKLFIKEITPEQKSMFDYNYEQDQILKDELSFIKQHKDNEEWDRKIKREAERLFEEWKACAPILINGKDYRVIMPVVNFGIGIIMMYNRNNMKYKDINPHDKVIELYNEMIERELQNSEPNPARSVATDLQ